MTKILAFAIYLGISLIQIVVGAWFIGDAIDALLHKKYFRFGLHVMLTVYTIIGLARNMIGGPF